MSVVDGVLCLTVLGCMPARNGDGYFYNLRGEVEVVAGTVKPIGHRDRKLSNTNPPERIFPIQIF